MSFRTRSPDNSEDDGDYQEMAEINIIPLVDIMLVLLIIFMVAAPLSISGITVNLPTSKVTSPLKEEKRIILSVSRDGKYFIDKMEIAAPILGEQFKALYEKREKKDLYIRADKRVVYEKIIDAMSAAKLAGIQKISMMTTAPEGAQ